MNDEITKISRPAFLMTHGGIDKASFLDEYRQNSEKPDYFLIFKKCLQYNMDLPENLIFIMNWQELYNKEKKISESVTIGKSSSNEICFPVICLSDNHGYFYWNNSKGLAYIDKNSLNGTLVNNKKTNGRTKVKSRDIIVFGRLEALLLNPEDAYKELIESNQ